MQFVSSVSKIPNLDKEMRFDYPVPHSYLVIKFTTLGYTKMQTHSELCCGSAANCIFSSKDFLFGGKTMLTRRPVCSVDVLCPHICREISQPLSTSLY
jgi:hypothetical protein